MAGRSAAPKRTKAKSATTNRHQKKIKSEPVTTVSSKTEKDVTKLINCLAQWTRDLEAVRSAASTVPSRRGSRSRSRVRTNVSSVSRAPRYPRGNPLTESMEFTDRNGAVWLAYIEGTEAAPSHEPPNVTVLPGRHLRFDSATESRFTCVLPAGSPFLPEARLQSLLDEAQPDPPMASTNGSSAALGGRVIESSARAIESTRGAMADWSRRLRQTATPSEAQRRHLSEMLAGAVNSMHGVVETLQGHRPIRP